MIRRWNLVGLFPWKKKTQKNLTYQFLVQKAETMRFFAVRRGKCSKITTFDTAVQQYHHKGHEITVVICCFCWTPDNFTNTYVIREVLIDYSKGKFVNFLVFVLLKEFNLVQTWRKIQRKSFNPHLPCQPDCYPYLLSLSRYKESSGFLKVLFSRLIVS